MLNATSPSSVSLEWASRVWLALKFDWSESLLSFTEPDLDYWCKVHFSAYSGQVTGYVRRPPKTSSTIKQWLVTVSCGLIVNKELKNVSCMKCKKFIHSFIHLVHSFIHSLNLVHFIWCIHSSNCSFIHSFSLVHFILFTHSIWLHSFIHSFIHSLNLVRFVQCILVHLFIQFIHSFSLFNFIMFIHSFHLVHLFIN